MLAWVDHRAGKRGGRGSRSVRSLRSERDQPHDRVRDLLWHRLFGTPETGLKLIVADELKGREGTLADSRERLLATDRLPLVQSNHACRPEASCGKLIEKRVRRREACAIDIRVRGE